MHTPHFTKQLSTWEKIGSLLVGLMISEGIAYIFYHSAVACILFTPFSLFFPKAFRSFKERKRQEQFTIQFKEWLYILSALMGAGKSLQTAFRLSLEEMDQDFLKPENVEMVVEIKNMIRLLDINHSVSEALHEVANRLEMEDMKIFADIVKTCEKSGGDVIDVIRTTIQIINEKLEVKNEIDVSIAQKRFENRIMSVLPVFMIGILSLSGEDYMMPMFGNVKGAFMMTISLLCMIGSFVLSGKILKIPV